MNERHNDDVEDAADGQGGNTFGWDLWVAAAVFVAIAGWIMADRWAALLAGDPETLGLAAIVLLVMTMFGVLLSRQGAANGQRVSK